MKMFASLLIIAYFSVGVGTTSFLTPAPWNYLITLVGIILSFFLGAALSKYVR